MNNDENVIGFSNSKNGYKPNPLTIDDMVLGDYYKICGINDYSIFEFVYEANSSVGLFRKIGTEFDLHLPYADLVKTELRVVIDCISYKVSENEYLMIKDIIKRSTPRSC